MPDAVDVEPVVGEHLAAGDLLADAVDQDLAAAAGQAAEARRPSGGSRTVCSGILELLVEEVDLGRAEAVDVHLGKCALMSRSRSSYHSNGRSGCRPPCIRIWSPPSVDGLADLLEQDVAVEDVSLGVADLAVEGAEVADGGADVRVVDVPVDVVGAVRLGMEPPADGVGGAAEREQVGLAEERRRPRRA